MSTPLAPGQDPVQAYLARYKTKPVQATVPDTADPVAAYLARYGGAAPASDTGDINLAPAPARSAPLPVRPAARAAIPTLAPMYARAPAETVAMRGPRALPGDAAAPLPQRGVADYALPAGATGGRMPVGPTPPLAYESVAGRQFSRAAAVIGAPATPRPMLRTAAPAEATAVATPLPTKPLTLRPVTAPDAQASSALADAETAREEQRARWEQLTDAAGAPFGGGEIPRMAAAAALRIPQGALAGHGNELADLANRGVARVLGVPAPAPVGETVQAVAERTLPEQLAGTAGEFYGVAMPVGAQNTLLRAGAEALPEAMNIATRAPTLGTRAGRFMRLLAGETPASLPVRAAAGAAEFAPYSAALPAETPGQRAANIAGGAALGAAGAAAFRPRLSRSTAIRPDAGRPVEFRSFTRGTGEGGWTEASENPYTVLGLPNRTVLPGGFTEAPSLTADEVHAAWRARIAPIAKEATGLNPSPEATARFQRLTSARDAILADLERQAAARPEPAPSTGPETPSAPSPVAQAEPLAPEATPVPPEPAPAPAVTQAAVPTNGNGLAERAREKLGQTMQAATDRVWPEGAERRQQAAETDQLTGLANQGAWLAARPRVEQDPNTRIVRGDLNGTKALNDTHGHAAGDEAIQANARAALAAAAEHGVSPRNVFRSGTGDEVSIAAPADVADAVAASWRQNYGLHEHGGGVRTSVAAGVGNTEAEADAAMYENKRAVKVEHGIGGREEDAPAVATGGAKYTLHAEPTEPEEGVQGTKHFWTIRDAEGKEVSYISAVHDGETLTIAEIGGTEADRGRFGTGTMRSLVREAAQQVAAAGQPVRRIVGIAGGGARPGHIREAMTSAPAQPPLAADSSPAVEWRHRIAAAADPAELGNFETAITYDRALSEVERAGLLQELAARQQGEQTGPRPATPFAELRVRIEAAQGKPAELDALASEVEGSTLPEEAKGRLRERVQFERTAPPITPRREPPMPPAQREAIEQATEARRAAAEAPLPGPEAPSDEYATAADNAWRASNYYGEPDPFAREGFLRGYMAHTAGNGAPEGHWEKIGWDVARRDMPTTEEPPETPAELPGPEPTPAGGFDAEAWDAREQAIKDAVERSKAEGNTHLDQMPWGVEAIRGQHFRSLRDGSEWIATSVDNRGVARFKSPDGTRDEMISGPELSEFVLVPEKAAARPASGAVPWESAKPGDVTGNATSGFYTVVRRHMRLKGKAKELAQQVGGQVWLDGPKAWAVLTPYTAEGQAAPAPEATAGPPAKRPRLPVREAKGGGRPLEEVRAEAAKVPREKPEAEEILASLRPGDTLVGLHPDYTDGREVRLTLGNDGVLHGPEGLKAYTEGDAFADEVAATGRVERFADPTQEGLFPERPSAPPAVPEAAPAFSTSDLPDQWWGTLMKARYAANVVGATEGFTGDWSNLDDIVAAVRAKLGEASAEVAPESPAPDTPVPGHGERLTRVRIRKAGIIPTRAGVQRQKQPDKFEETYADGTELTRDESGKVLTEWKPEVQALESAPQGVNVEMGGTPTEPSVPPVPEEEGGHARQVRPAGGGEPSGEPAGPVPQAEAERRTGRTPRGRTDEGRAGGAGVRGAVPAAEPAPEGLHGEGGAPAGGEAERGGSGDAGRRARSGRGNRSRDDERVHGLNYRITAKDRIGQGGLKEKARANLDAIRILKQIEAEGRQATAAEQAQLVRYVGWGGLPQAFNTYHPDYGDIARDLQGLLSPEEYEAARASTPNAHYTSETVIRGIYDALARLGYEGGLTLEPSMGVGHFIGLMPPKMEGASRWTGVELDEITGRIAKLLYPRADVRVEGFEATHMPDSFYDVAVGNVPFGDYPVHDPKFKGARAFLTKQIHDYFFARTLEKVRPGGVVAFITSKGTLDKIDPKVREYLSQQADLLGAIRLPNTAFQGNANTSVTTDILFLRRRAAGEKPADTSWLGTSDITSSRGERIRVNNYFAAHPEMMLGEMRLEGTMYRGSEPTLVPREGEDLGDALAAAVAKLPKGVLKPPKAPKATDATEADEVMAPDAVKQGGYTLGPEGDIRVKQGRRLVKADVPATAAPRVKALMGLRDATRAVLHAQLTGQDPAAIAKAQQALSRAYDAFVRKYGAINREVKSGKGVRRPNIAHFTDDPDAPLVEALEIQNPETGAFEKAAIFTKRVLEPNRRAVSADTPRDALLLSLNERGRVDLEHIAQLSGRTADAVLDDLRGLVYRNPETGAYETDDAYLSGNVRQKLLVARAAARTDPAFTENVEALEKVQPDDLKPSEIDATLGAPWIPREDIAAFVTELLGARQPVSITHLASEAEWSVDIGHSDVYGVANMQDWGTKRAPASRLIEDALNQRATVVSDHDPVTDRSVKNVQETLAAQEKQEALKHKFREWLWAEPERADRLMRKYNDEFNNIRLRTYNGDHLTLPGASTAVTLRPHQKGGVWRILQSGNTLLAHVVGAGKTNIMVAAGMEAKRVGLARKPAYAVPNHMLKQFANELLQLYPSANILVASKADFKKGRRQAFMSRIATGDWDAVVMTHSSFGKLPMSSEFQKQYLEQQIAEYRAMLEEAKQGSNRDLTKQIEKALKRREAKVRALANAESKDTTVAFEELGIDMLFVDEAHMFKNLETPTKMRVPTSESQRAMDLFMKTRYLEQINPGRGVIFATGTPISNSMVEMFTMQRYLQHRLLEERGMTHFDAWAASFGDSVTALELAPDGSGYRMNTRFARFRNVPELMQMYRQVADVQTAAMLKLPVPKVRGGAPETVSVPASAEQVAFVADLVKRAELVRNRRVDPDVDNMLKITGDGRKAALDMRLVDPSAPDFPGSKVNRAIDYIFEGWKDTKKTRAAQLVFCDLSTPKKAGEGFSVYNDVREKLIRRGVPEKEIAFIHDADTDTKKEALFKAVREGRVRILMGSTEKMGAGMNVQHNLLKEMHLDAPWRPSDIEQREGRIVRQLNRNEEVEIYRFVTEGTFDAYMWQTLETKARFIGQVMTGDATVRSMEDVDSRALTFAEVKAIASGNPLVMEKAGIDAEVAKLSRLQRAHQDSQYDIRREVARLPQSIQHDQQKIAQAEKDIAQCQETSGDKFSVTLGGQTYTKRADAAEALSKALLALPAGKTPRRVGRFAGFEVLANRTVFLNIERSTLTLRGAMDHEAEVRLDTSPQGILQSLEHMPRSLERALEGWQKTLADDKRRLSDLKKLEGKPFEHADRLAELEKKQAEIAAKLDINKSDQQAEAGREATEGGTVKDEDLGAEEDEGGGAVAGMPEGRRRFPTRTGARPGRPERSAPAAPEAPGDGQVGAPDPEDIPAADATARPADPLRPENAERISEGLTGRLERPPKPEPGKPVSAPQVIDAFGDITEAAGRRIAQRVGHMGGHFRGVFLVEPEVIRTRSANNIPTSAHEVAHALEKLVWGWVKGSPWRKPQTSRAMQQELLALGRALYGSTRPAAGYKREGFAEFVRLWLTTDGAAVKQAPEFSTWFDGEFAREHPAVRKALENARALATRWRAQGSYARAQASLVDPASPTARAKQALQGLRRAFNYTSLVEMAQPQYEIAREAEARLGRKLAPEEDPFAITTALRMTHAARTRYMIERGMIDLAGNRVGPALDEIRALVKGRKLDFTIYLWAKRTLALWDDPRGARASGLSREDARQLIEELGSPEFELAAGKVYDWNDGVLNYAAQASPTFRDVVDKMRERDPGAWMPLQREFDELERVWAGAGGGGARARTGSLSARLKGSGRRVKDLFPTMIARAEGTVRAAHERAVIDAILKLSKVEGMGDLVEEVPVQQRPAAHATISELIERINRELEQRGADTSVSIEGEYGSAMDAVVSFFAPVQKGKGGEPIVPVMDQGQLRWFYVAPDLYNSLMALDVYRLPEVAGLPLLDWIFGKFARAFRAGTTGLRASFGLVTNPLRDPQSLWVNSAASAQAPEMLRNWTSAMASAFRVRALGAEPDVWMDALLRLGGEMAQSLGQDIPHTRRAAHKLFESRTVRVLDPRNWLDWYRDLVQFPESAPRVAELRAVAKDIGWEPGQPMSFGESLQLLTASKQPTTDFTAGGSLARVMNQAVPFFNAAIQGPRALGRAGRRNPRKVLFRGLALAVPTLLLYWMHKDEDWYKELDYRERFLNWHLPFEFGGRKELARIPRGFEIGLLFAALPEALLDSWYRQDPRAASEWFSTFAQATAPDVTPVALREMKEQWRNREDFFDRPIVPQGEMNLPEEEQFNEYTSRAAIALGHLFHASPRRIDHAVKGIFGPVAGDILAVVGLGPEGQEREKELADVPVVGRLFARGGETGTRPLAVTDLYDQLEAAQKRQASRERPETKEERRRRLQLEDAAKAVSALLYVRRYASQSGQRDALTAEVATIADDAVQMNTAGQFARGRFRKSRVLAERQRDKLEREQKKQRLPFFGRGTAEAAPEKR